MTVRQSAIDVRRADKSDVRVSRDTNVRIRPPNESNYSTRSTETRSAVGRLYYLKSMGTAGSGSIVERIDL